MRIAFQRHRKRAPLHHHVRPPFQLSHLAVGPLAKATTAGRVHGGCVSPHANQGCADSARAMGKHTVGAVLLSAATHKRVCGVGFGGSCVE